MTAAADVFSSLPALESVSHCAESERKPSTAVLRFLRETARNHRNTEFRPFYSIRAVSNHFRVAPTTVSRIYARLRDEGLLRTVWGSRTFIEPTRIDKHLEVRGIVGLPAELSCFCSGREYRAFFLTMRNILWRLGFATRLIFYEGQEGEAPKVAQLLCYKVDTVIWLQPDPGSRAIARRLVDHGVRLLTVSDSSALASSHAYHLSRQCAIRDALIAWKRNAITSVTVTESRDPSPASRAMIEGCLREVGMPYTVLGVESWVAQDGMPGLLQPGNSGIVFPSSESAIQLSSKYSAHLAKLSRQAGVMLVEGMIDLPMGEPFSVATDVIEFDWPLLTERIGADLIRPAGSPAEKPPAFEARWLHFERTNSSTDAA